MVPLVTFLPFLIWDPGRLYHSLVVAQGSVYPFRTSSLGLSNFLIALGWIETPRDAYSSFLMYLLFVLPPAVYAMRRLVLRPSLADLLLAFTVVLFAFLFVSRHFAFNYLWLVFVMAVCAVWVRLDPEQAPAGPRTTPV